MANSYKLEVVTPERVILSADVVETNAPGSEGYLGVLAYHMPLLTALIPGEVRTRLADGNNSSTIVISGGFMEISPTKTTILADSAEMADEINVDAAQADLLQARSVLATSEPGSDEYRKSLKDIAYAEARIRVSRA